MPFLESTIAVMILWACLGYLLGSIPSGVIIARLMNLGNLRDIGSGNIGATNVLRTGNKKAAAMTLLFDAAKGIAAVVLASIFAAEDAAQLAGLMAFLGHCFPVWLKFKGGKGVATYLGVIGGLAPFLGLVACGIWLVVALISRYSSLAALVAAGWLPIVMAMTGYGTLFLLGVILALLIYARHWGNIQRMKAGTETKIGAKA
ncbi:glycerol-3-phosphate 1-O-acyltransferase PlsY [Yoonia sediminilitoris]|uniref:Glycerol-3-phosphate acyltransferase n=1 Tax=Yoonia sediminilitoris TaxID=1286148 RepID=A0A2T6KIA8_9RHOB|nr:glycerol-3-phosphate 1-O-acyltransferase PlsY [Yoonia sediminilitoris]PUB15454.1 acyl-phosphate glycerol-3-phosphate acyltransferase [Yoonia sediminilitoris]RCW96064.1 acyl-phosphate glycerol-3-phosphate acyltransferase [Yoonia sediminilitoris]